MTKNKLVAVAMSGGVDSSLTAKLLLDEGYEVIGITLKLWQDDAYQNNKAEVDAKKVADFLGIKHIVLDLQELFYSKVVDNFITQYKCGRTPNPCVMCNKHIKFGALLDEALKLGADFMATGHYVRKYHNLDNGSYYLQKAVDQAKDQSYVLYNLTQDKIAKMLFPLGVYAKPQVRQLAEKFALPVFNKADSQEICFIPDDDYRSFLDKYSKTKDKPGNFVDSNNNILGKHKGLTNYTIGQRRGLNIALGEKMYVVKLDCDKNEVVLGRLNELFADTLTAQQVVLADDRKRHDSYSVSVKIRYNAPCVPAVVTLNGDNAHVQFNTPQKSITPGQSVAFYEDDILIGGGIID